MNRAELEKVLADHKAWLETEGRAGERAILLGANLCGADLRDADLHCADLRGADLRSADLRGVDLCDADLRGADLCRANLGNADLRGADLRGANLHRANLCGADLGGADFSNAKLDYSCWPLWCGSLNVTIDAWQAAQLMYHTLRAMQSVQGDADVEAVLSSPAVIRLANRFLRADECGRIKCRKGGAA